MYEPAEDSYLLQECIKEHISKNEIKFALDMGTGSGIQAFTMCEKAEFTLAVDIDKDAINHVKNEIIEKGLSNSVEAISSDLFSEVPHRFLQKFDLIVFNAPYLPKGEDDYEDSELYGGLHGIHITEQFLEQAKDFLAEKGIIFFVASSLAKIDLLEKHMQKLNYNFEIIKKKHISFEDIILYKAWF